MRRDLLLSRVVLEAPGPRTSLGSAGRLPLVSTLDEVLRDPATRELLAGIAAEGDPLLQPRARDVLASLTGAADPGEPGLTRWLRDHRPRLEWNDSLGRFVVR